MDHTAGAETSETEGDTADPDAGLTERFLAIRCQTERLARDLTAEDQCVQSMPDASPVKWHRAHTTWFFEEFVLRSLHSAYRPFDPEFRFLFNSYYEAVGARYPRPSRGLLTRPSAERITAYRRYVDQAVSAFLQDPPRAAGDLVELGLHHEQQHQELIVSDTLHAFAQNPLAPAILPEWQEPAGTHVSTQMIEFPGGIAEIGAGPGFAFDNERPRHEILLYPFRLADRLVRNGEWLAFIADGGYRQPTLWMSDGWALVEAQGWNAPLYWRWHDDAWWQMGPGGLAPLDPAMPVRNVSWYEADAFARWAAARLPTEAEWEIAAADPRIQEQTGHVWQWTASPYTPYPGFQPEAGAIGEYNGKFMVNQMVLRGGSLATPVGHARRSYRNFFHPDKRWQFSGLRLAQST
jgi:ergothioneine biosynthesis protein EgtB